ncbi:efflux transporter outer membrane subunit [Ramlibacter tataouinensis]|uniref:efflux transporter outer membrane subunit n=1 Tax=Ramlibacter tataouinensis TaxID=94132 RepID=UPI0022F3F030|nr:efflux transporter outer membrane subunit [Ramlibacter tataouinensis]WBY00124.1 efflux transporter outer membrane subunit [Ramlibacter tataouinensis]
MNTFRPLAAAAALLALAGCALPRPPAAAEAPIAPGWYAPIPHDGRPADLQRWWQQLGDPLLPELIDAAQAANPSVSAAGSRIAQARADRAAAHAALLPALDASASVGRGNQQAALPGTTATVSQVGAQTAWELDLFGGRAAGRDAAQARLAAARAGWHEARVAVAAETAASYFGWRTCQLQLAVAGNDARSRAESARLIRLSSEAGFAAPADAALARASAAEGAARERQQRAACETELKGLVALTALPEPALRQQLAAPWQPPAEAVLAPVPALPAQLLAQRPDVFGAQLAVAAASADVGAAQADRYPRLALSGSVAAGSVRVGGASTDAQSWSIGPLALSLPLFDGGRRAANVEAAQARYEDAAAQYRGRVRQAVREVEQALLALDSARSRNDDARIAAEGYRASFAATEARLRAGLASVVELEDARRTLLAAETALVGLQREGIGAWIDLYRAAGGGWSAAASAGIDGTQQEQGQSQ